MCDFQKWEIWEADVPFREDSSKSKRRPVLIVSPTEVLVLKMTPHQHSDRPRPYEYEVMKWKEAGLTAQTYVQCDQYIQLGHKHFKGRQYGRLQLIDIVLLQQMMKYHGLAQ